MSQKDRGRPGKGGAIILPAVPETDHILSPSFGRLAKLSEVSPHPPRPTFYKAGICQTMRMRFGADELASPIHVCL